VPYGSRQFFAVSDNGVNSSTSEGVSIEILSTIEDLPSCEALPAEALASWQVETSSCFIDGTLTLDSDDELTVGFGVNLLVNSEADASISGTLTLDSGSQLYIESDGTMEITSTGSLDNFGEINIFGVMNNSGTIDNIGFMSVDSFGHLVNTATGEIDNSGTIENFAGETITNYGTIFSSGRIENDATFNNYGTLEIDDEFNNSGVLNNNGTIAVTDFGLLENEGIINNDCEGVINGSVQGNQPLPACLFFEETFPGSFDSDSWDDSIATDTIRWCSPTDELEGSGLWQDTEVVACDGMTEVGPYGSIPFGSSVSILSDEDPSRAFPYVFTSTNPIPEDGDFVFETRISFDSFGIYGAGLYLRDWPDSTPSGDNPPGDSDAEFQIWGDESFGVTVASNGEDFGGVTTDTEYHTYRLEYID
jgi:hypothetical protein